MELLTYTEPLWSLHSALMPLFEVDSQPKRYLGLHGWVEGPEVTLRREKGGGTG